MQSSAPSAVDRGDAEIRRDRDQTPARMAWHPLTLLTNVSNSSAR